MPSDNEARLISVSGEQFEAIRGALAPAALSFAQLDGYRVEVGETGGKSLVTFRSFARASEEPKVVLGGQRASRDERSALQGGSPAEVVGPIEGRDVRAIETAREVFAQRLTTLDLKHYRIHAEADAQSTLVSFIDADAKRGVRGSPGRPGFEVEMRSRDYSIVRANFVR